MLEMPIVLLPTQLLPFHTDHPLHVSQLRQAAQANEFIALKPKLQSAADIATLIQVMPNSVEFFFNINKFCGWNSHKYDTKKL